MMPTILLTFLLFWPLTVTAQPTPSPRPTRAPIAAFDDKQYEHDQCALIAKREPRICRPESGCSQFKDVCPQKE